MLFKIKETLCSKIHWGASLLKNEAGIMSRVRGLFVIATFIKRRFYNRVRSLCFFLFSDSSFRAERRRRRRRKRRRKRRGGVRLLPDRTVRKQERRVEFFLLGWAVGGGGGRCLRRINWDWSRRGGPGAPSAAAAVTPDTIDMELENIVANTVLLKAREGKDGDGGLTAPLSRYLTDTAAVQRQEGCPGHGWY